MMHWLAVPLLVAAGIGQEPGSLRAKLIAGRKVASVVGGSDHVAVAADGSAVATVDSKRKVAIILDLADGTSRESSHVGSVGSIALLSNGRGYWLGLLDGSIVHAPARGEVRVFEIVPGKQIDGIAHGGGHVVWSSSAADRGGVVDARDGKPRFACDVPFGGYRQPRMFLSRDARHVVHYAKDPGRGGRRILLVKETVSGKQIASAKSYVSHRDRSHVFGLDGVFTAARIGSKWQLHRLDLVDLQNWVIDDDLRGKHFVDLFLSPSSQYLLEGDFEDDGAVLYHLADGGAHRAGLGSKVLPVGFLGAADNGEELALTTSSDSRGLVAWSTKTGKRVAELPVGKGKQITQAGSLLGGHALWFHWWESQQDRVVVHHLEVVRFGR